MVNVLPLNGLVLDFAVVKLPERLLALRTAAGWTIYRAAKEAELKATQYKLIEDGTNDNPTLKTLERIASAYGITVSALLDDGQGAVQPKPRPDRKVEAVLAKLARTQKTFSDLAREIEAMDTTVVAESPPRTAATTARGSRR